MLINSSKYVNAIPLITFDQIPSGWGGVGWIWIYRQAVHLPVHDFIIRRTDDLQRAVVSGISDITPRWNKTHSITYYLKNQCW
jgi:hypothetical protein